MIGKKAVKKAVFGLGMVVGCLAGTAWTQCHDIRIPRGQISTVVNGLTIRKYICYRVRARPGQLITLHLTSPDPKVKFSLNEDYYDSDFTAEDVRDWQGEVGNVNAYLMMVGGGRIGSRFKIELTIR